MTTQPRALPMAPAGCSLDDSRLVEQLDRYRRLGRMALSVREDEPGLLVTFGAEVDVDLLRETIAIERGCCSFLTFEYDPSDRRLSIVIDDPVRVDAVRALLAALRDPAGSPTGR
jgi:hypothetical protein